MKNNKGITLIALVITIIVMLILVGVTVSAAINGKLFDTAKKAAKDTEKAKQEETILKDYTCPNVLKIHKIAEEYARKRICYSFMWK